MLKNDQYEDEADMYSNVRMPSAKHVLCADFMR